MYFIRLSKLKAELELLVDATDGWAASERDCDIITSFTARVYSDFQFNSGSKKKNYGDRLQWRQKQILFFIDAQSEALILNLGR